MYVALSRKRSLLKVTLTGTFTAAAIKADLIAIKNMKDWDLPDIRSVYKHYLQSEAFRVWFTMLYRNTGFSKTKYRQYQGMLERICYSA